jgi:lambda family phage portal protein
LDQARIDRSTFSGIEYNGLQRSAYWLFERHPTLAPLKSVRIPAEQVLHIFRPVAPGSERGISWLAPILISLRDLQEYLEAETQRAKIASLYCGFIQVEAGSPLVGPSGVPTLEPGSMVKLNPGEVVEMAKPPDAGSNFDPFVRALLRKIASGCGVPYEILSNDSSQITFASGRHGLLEYQRKIEAIQYVFLVPQVCQPVLDRWSELAVAMGVIPSVQPARWIAPRLAMLDEGAETRATIAKIRSGFTSRTEVVSQLGWDVAQIDAEIAGDNQRADKLGLILDSDPRRVSQMGQEQQSQAQQGGDKP